MVVGTGRRGGFSADENNPFFFEPPPSPGRRWWTQKPCRLAPFAQGQGQAWRATLATRRGGGRWRRGAGATSALGKKKAPGIGSLFLEGDKVGGEDWEAVERSRRGGGRD